MVDFEKTGIRFDPLSMRRRQNTSRLHRTIQGRSVERTNGLRGQPFRQSFHLLTPNVAQFHIGRSGKPIFGRKHRGTVTDEKDACFHDALVSVAKCGRQPVT